MVEVSVVMITYNHESFIKDALIGVLEQKADFSIELILANDCSSDNTDAVIRSVIESYHGPISIVYTNNVTNLGMMGNFINALKRASGKYIALCEGDDYWTDSLKLQKQYDFLEQKSEYVLCFHKAKILEINGSLVDDYLTTIPKRFEFHETLAVYGNFIHTPTVMFRNICKSFPDELNHTPVGDYFLYMILAQHGKIGMLTDTMAVYRHGVGVWSSLTGEIRSINFIYALSLIYNYFQKSNKHISYLVLQNLNNYMLGKLHLFYDTSLIVTDDIRKLNSINSSLAMLAHSLKQRDNISYQFKRYIRGSFVSIFYTFRKVLYGK